MKTKRRFHSRRIQKTRNRFRDIRHIICLVLDILLGRKLGSVDIKVLRGYFPSAHADHSLRVSSPVAKLQ